MKEILVVDSITKSFKLSKKQQKLSNINTNRIVAVDNMSFNAYEGEIFGLLGPNGAGKTTMLRMLATLIKAESGDAYIKGLSIRDKQKEVRKNIGFLTSELKLEDFFTPNYLFDFFGKLHGVDKDKLKDYKDNLFKKFGIDKFSEVKVANLSTGMKQKTSLAISIVHNPDFIIFDEPTNGLDILTAKIVTDFLVELKAEGKSIIVSTHIFSLAEKLCDRVGIIIDGKLIKCDLLKKLTNDKTLEELFFELYYESSGEII